MSVLLIDLTGNYFIYKNEIFFLSLTLSILIYQTSTPCLIVAERKIISYWRKLLLQISTNLYSLVSVRHHRDQEVDEDDRGDQQVEDEDKLRWEEVQVKTLSMDENYSYLKIFNIVRIFWSEHNVSLAAQPKQSKEEFDDDEIRHFKSACKKIC